MDKIYASGFAFLREVEPGVIEFENKYTGLILRYDVRTGQRTVEECAI